MPSFDSTKKSLPDLLSQIVHGRIQLPDFQRGWIWDDEHIRSLLVSIARAFPIGSIMLLQTGGDAKFQIRPVEGITLSPSELTADQLILDGQQRLTSLTQVLMLKKAIKTKDNQKREVERYYYIDIEKAMEGNSSIEDAIIGVDGTKIIRKDFGRTIALDLSTQEKEFEHFFFPCCQIMNSDRWEQGLTVFNLNHFQRYMQFRTKVLNTFREYEVPIITLNKDNTKEAVCLVFEKVNTGGVALSVFELITATYAADGFNLRDDWYGSEERGVVGRQKTLMTRPLLREIESTDFLQALTLLHTYDDRIQDIQAGRTGRDITAISAKREQVLNLPIYAYQNWAGKLIKGFLEADRFLRWEGFRSIKFLPYRTQLVPLAAVMVHLGDRWQEPLIYDKLAHWFWCGVFGELYGGAVETRIALDLGDLMNWFEQPNAPEPATIVAAGFQVSRLDTLRTRTSAAYRGLYVLLQREGARDLFWKARMVDIENDEYDQCLVDIHHIFPRKWCEERSISPRIYNSIVNKTAISSKANKIISGNAPSHYLPLLQNHPSIRITKSEQDSILKTHLIDPSLLRRNAFDRFYDQRKLDLIKLIEKAMGKGVITTSLEATVEDAVEDEYEG